MTYFEDKVKETKDMREKMIQKLIDCYEQWNEYERVADLAFLFNNFDLFRADVEGRIDLERIEWRYIDWKDQFGQALSIDGTKDIGYRWIAIDYDPY